MTIDFNIEEEGMRVTVLVITNSVETHSALQSLPENIEITKYAIRDEIKKLLKIAAQVPKKS